MTRYIKNTAILFAAMAITKIVGALFKIPLANLLGGTGMGYFSTAYGLYSPIFALTAAGVPTVIMRTTARSVAAGNRPYAAAVRRCALLLFTVIGLLGSAAVAAFAVPFAQHIACSPQSTLAVICISPAVMICCTASVLRGYREGLSDVMPSAAASVAEAVSRAVFGLGLSYAVIFYAKSAFYNGRQVFGTDAVTIEQAYAAALPYAAAGAILAVSVSELFGLLTLILNERRVGSREPLPPSYRRRDICFQLLKETAPIAASALVMNCVSFVDLLTVTRTLSVSAASDPEYFNAAFGGIYAACGGVEGLPNFMYGSYTGIAMSLFMLIPSFAGMTEKTAAPEIAAAWERGNKEELSGKIAMQIRAGALIACPACFGAAALAEPILSTLYRSRAAEVSVCLTSFRILCFGGLFMVVSSALFGIFQAVNKAHIPLILMTGSVLLKLLLNPLLISIPRLNIAGAALSSIIGYVFMTVGGVLMLKRFMPQSIDIAGAVKLPLLCGMGCGLAAFAANKMLSGMIGDTLNIVFSTITGALVYAILLFLTGVFRTSGIIKRKNVKNFKKPLAK
ncbi:MAG: polysaccharide biosynthesis C-terminal domain-containing protein [Oscillospiraceae bacterium]|nr:polysaccharide biosynthesis C-terminal domain-containing protein [Oscillospiraceae bacterium]